MTEFPTSIECNRKKLMTLLAAALREAQVNGKKVAQAHSCIIRYSTTGLLETVSLVRDGVSSVHHLHFTTQTPPKDDGMLVIPSIVRMLGVLKMHKSDRVTMVQNEDRLKINSKGKQTTILANLNALAYPGARSSVIIWEAQSQRIMGKVCKSECGRDLSYLAEDGKEYYPIMELKAIEASLLAEAFSFDSLNSQNKGAWSLRTLSERGAFIVSGEEMKGKTVCKVYETEDELHEVNIEMGGGLYSIFSTHLSGNTTISIFDFREQGQGWRVVFSSENGMVVQIGRDHDDS